MINEKYNFIRIHIKKTGGRSFWPVIGDGDLGHLSWRDYYKQLNSKIKNYFVWSVVRNPWQRMVSLFFHEKNETGLLHTNDFSRFIEDIYLHDKFRYGKNHQYDTRPQTDMLKDYTNELAVDFIGNLANIQEDFNKLKKRLKFPEEWTYPHHGAQKHDDYRKYYNKLSHHYVSQLFEEEIKLFNFDFEDNKKFKYLIQDLEKEPFQMNWRNRLK
jgi:hypothetical protein